MKARHFILVLRDHFREQFEDFRRWQEFPPASPSPSETSFDTTSSTMSHPLEHEEWTLEYINITRLQPIIEAFDDDASGFITISEVNAFTTSKPQDCR